ncbi:MAG: YfhO family protein, partial [Anaerolineae bacterium]|nr:YfhO family protein [Anaerolineae bacterium]
VYGGALVFPVLINILFLKKDKRIYLWPLLYVFALIFALGIRPLFAGMQFLPGLNLLRVPSRALFVALIALIISTAQVLNLLFDFSKQERIIFGYNLMIFGSGVFGLLVASGMAIVNSNLALEFFWGAIFLIIFLILLIIKDTGKIRYSVWMAILIPFILIDLLGVNASLYRHELFDKILEQGANIAKIIQSGKPGRIYSPTYSMPQQSGAYYRVNQSDGINPMQLSGYSEYMAEAGGFNNNAYSVTLPPFPNGVPTSPPDNLRLDLNRLGNLSVRYIVSAFPIKQNDLHLIDPGNSIYIYENMLYKPEIYLLKNGQILEPVFNKRGDDLISLTINGPGQLMISEVNFPGWQIYVDGRKTEFDKTDDLLLQTHIEAGQHEVIIQFKPDVLMPLLAISLCILIMWCLTMVKLDRKKRI